MHVPDKLRNKLSNKAEKCIFVGYLEGTKGYKFYNINTRKFIRSRDVIFFENDFVNLEEEDGTDVFQVFPDEEIVIESFDINNQNVAPDIVINEVRDDDVGIEVRDDIDVELRNNANVEENVDVRDSDNSTDEGMAGSVGNLNMTFEDKFLTKVKEIQRNGSRRERKLPTRFREYSNICDQTDLTFDNIEPVTVNEALSNKKWHDAMKSEMDSLVKNDTWSLVQKHDDMNTIGSKWVFKIKRNSNGEIIKHKARLVAQGYSQIHGLDYSEVFPLSQNFLQFVHY